MFVGGVGVSAYFVYITLRILIQRVSTWGEFCCLKLNIGHKAPKKNQYKYALDTVLAVYV